MRDAETRALRHAVAVLLLLALVRWGWSALRPPASIPGADVLPELLTDSRDRLAEATERGRPLGPGERLDPNRATAAELDRLPGVGAGTAAAIVRERTAHGPFRSPEGLVRVPGIGPGMLEKLLPHVRLGDAGVAPSRPSAGHRGGTPGRGRPQGGPGPEVEAPIDVNQADEEALQTLPGIGPALARRIVEARKERPFASVEDLVRVRGIGPVTVKRLRSRVRVHR